MNTKDVATWPLRLLTAVAQLVALTIITILASPFILLFLICFGLPSFKRSPRFDPPLPTSLGCPRWRLSNIWMIPVQCRFAPGHDGDHEAAEYSWVDGDIGSFMPEEFLANYAGQPQRPVRFWPDDGRPPWWERLTDALAVDPLGLVMPQWWDIECSPPANVVALGAARRA